MAKRYDNPFTPTFGDSPPVFGGRDDMLQSIREVLRPEAVKHPQRRMLLVAPKGYGKTALLAEAAAAAKRSGSWVVIGVDTGTQHLASRVEDEVRDLIRYRERRRVVGLRWLAALTKFVGRVLGLPVNGPTPKQNGAQSTPNVRSLFREITARNKKAPGISLLVDELHKADVDTVRRLGNDLQLLANYDDVRVVFIGAGLPQVRDLIRESKSTFLSRIYQHDLPLLSADAVRQTLASSYKSIGVTADDQALSVAAAACYEGHPYMVQLIGFNSVRQARRRDSSSISAEDTYAAIETADVAMAENLLRDYWITFSAEEKNFLKRLAELGGAATESAIGRSTGYNSDTVEDARVSLLRTNLIKVVDENIHFTLRGSADWIAKMYNGRHANHTWE